MKNTVKTVVCAVLAALFALTLAACGENKPAEVTHDYDVAEFAKSIADNCAFEDRYLAMIEDRDFALELYKIDPALVAEKNGAKEAVVYVSSATPEMIVCVKGANNDSASGIIAAVKKIISNYIENYTEYGPEQVAKLQSAVIKQDGAYVFIAVTNDNAAADSYISGLLKK